MKRKTNRPMEGDQVPRKSVWIVNHYALTRDDSGGLTRHFDFASEFHQHGWHATIIAAATVHPSGRLRKPIRFWPRLERIGDVDFLWVPTTPYSGNGLDRILNMIIFFVVLLLPRATRAARAPDVIVGSSPHPLSAAAGALLAQRRRIPFIYEVRDLWPEALINMGRLARGGLLAKAMFCLEGWLYGKAASVIGLWPLLENYSKARGFSFLRTDWISNGVRTERFQPDQNPGRKGQFALMYFGAHGGANDLENVIKAMAIVRNAPGGDGISLRLVGDGPNKPGLVALANTLGCENVVFEAPVSKNMIPRLAATADAFVFNLVDAQMFRYGISPNKLFEYMAAARPILFSCKAEWNPVAESGSGLSVPPNDPEALAEAIIRLSRMSSSEREAMGLRGRRYVEDNFHLSRLARRFADCLDQADANAFAKSHEND